TKTNLLERGLRFCGTPTQKVYWSEGNKLPILAWNNRGLLTANIQYRYENNGRTSSNGCVVELEASTRFKIHEISMGDDGEDGNSPIPTNINCTFIVKAPAGKKIEVVLDLVYTYSDIGCSAGGIELKTKTDM
ncbi:hypothetical protein PMAYCL1PPCAC_31291, partial [Pristionchus mayeri]